jgi:hypothetical protein
MHIGVTRSAVDADLASVTVGVGAIQASPVPLFAERPTLSFCFGYSSLNLLVGVPGPAQFTSPIIAALLTVVNGNLFSSVSETML